MDIFTIIMWVGTILFLIISFLKDKDKTTKALKMAFGMGRSMVISIFSIIFLIGLILTFITPEMISGVIAKHSTMLSTIICALFGTITLIPAFIAFPIVGTFIDAGVSIMPAVAFLTTLTMVGIVTFPLEKQEFGLKFAVTRNLMSFVFAIIIALGMGVLM
jgi:uncharacterized membrane protein YraQ (UPF0718 family)